jgi:hypothetical protein
MKGAAVFLGAVLLGASAQAQSALAQTTTLARAGAWEAFGGTSDGGRPVCGLAAEGNDRYFGFKAYAGEPAVRVQLVSPRWQIRPGAQQALSVSIDRHPAWDVTAVGTQFPGGTSGLEFFIDRRALGDFLQQFRQGQELRIAFMGSNAQPWTGSLAGSNLVAMAFLACVRDAN